jgi:hypothetical protein
MLAQQCTMIEVPNAAHRPATMPDDVLQLHSSVGPYLKVPKGVEDGEAGVVIVGES